jgi:hypothetical protein
MNQLILNGDSEKILLSNFEFEVAEIHTGMI